MLDLFHRALDLLHRRVEGEEVDLEGLTARLKGAHLDPAQEGPEPFPTREDLPAQAPSRAQEPLRVAPAKLDAVQASIGELVVVGLAQSALHEAVSGLRADFAGLQREWRTLQALSREAQPGRALERRVAAVDLKVKGLYRAIFRMSHQSAVHLGHLSQVTECLETALRSLRMMPLGPYFETFQVAVREAARSRDKRVRLRSLDRGIEVDRLILDRLRDPLLHLLRNAVTHGIESPDRRRELGKSEVGEITLEAELMGDRVTVHVVDDGAGIDRRAVLRRARDSGVVSSLEDLTDPELLDFLCRPGFSTAAGVDELSGRGVGLDAVQGRILDLRGRLWVTSVEGQSTRFSLDVPVTQSQTRGLVVQVGPHQFGLPLDCVERVLRVRRESLQTVGARESSTVPAPRSASPAWRFSWASRSWPRRPPWFPL